MPLIGAIKLEIFHSFLFIQYTDFADVYFLIFLAAFIPTNVFSFVISLDVFLDRVVAV